MFLLANDAEERFFILFLLTKSLYICVCVYIYIYIYICISVSSGKFLLLECTATNQQKEMAANDGQIKLTICNLKQVLKIQ